MAYPQPVSEKAKTYSEIVQYGSRLMKLLDRNRDGQIITVKINGKKTKIIFIREDEDWSRVFIKQVDNGQASWMDLSDISYTS